MGKFAFVIVLSLLGVALAAPKKQSRAPPPVDFEDIYSDLLCRHLCFYKTKEKCDTFFSKKIL